MTDFFNARDLQFILDQHKQIQSILPDLQMAHQLGRILDESTIPPIDAGLSVVLANTATNIGMLDGILTIPAQSIIDVTNILSQTQLFNLDWLQQISPSIELYRTLLGNNALISTMIEQLNIFSVFSGLPIHANFENLFSQTTAAVKAYDTYYQGLGHTLEQTLLNVSWETRLVIPTTMTTSLVSTSISLAKSYTNTSEQEAETPFIRGKPPTTYVSSETYGSMLLRVKDYLAPHGERFVAKWEGAWQTLSSMNDDRRSQATHSARELLMQLLAYLAPDEVLGEKPTRKMRVKYILKGHGNQTVELIDTTAKALDNMYDLLCGEAHRRDDVQLKDETIAGYLTTLGGLLITLLSQHDD